MAVDYKNLLKLELDLHLNVILKANELSSNQSSSRKSNPYCFYKLSNIPQLSTSKDAVRKANKLQITNTSKWAKYALDIEEGRFTPPNFPRRERPGSPIGNVVKTGKRDPDSLTLRGQISGGDGGARITAPLDWYSTYLKGGKFKKALRKGLQMGFKGKK